MSIQNLSINLENCHYIAQEEFDLLSTEKKVVNNDVLVTVDGGTSIGKPVLFDLEVECTVDSHVCILRPKGLEAMVLTYLLASPLGQLQFHMAESGASGQTAVTEEDIRLFRFPVIPQTKLNLLVESLHQTRASIIERRDSLYKQETEAWQRFNDMMLEDST